MAPADAAAERTLEELAPGAVRAADEADAIDGARPRWIVEPDTAEAMAAVLAWASAHRQPVVLRGGGTHLAWGRRPADVGLVVSTRRLNRLIRYEPGDLTVSVEAGMSIDALNGDLARHGQWLPIDAASDASTVGGAIATNDSGPLRHKYGTPRDQIIGVRLATADGRLASAGGQVVKNVAGYDLGKLVAGSFGAFGGIVSATFKLAPIPATSATLVASFDEGNRMVGAAALLAGSQLDPMCLDAEARAGREPRARLLVRFGGTAAPVAEQIAAAAAMARSTGSTTTETFEGEAEFRLWRERVAVLAGSDRGTTVRASWMPAALPAVLALLARVAHEGHLDVIFNGRAGVGAGIIRIDGEPVARATGVARLREASDTLGHVVVTDAGADAKERMDVWGPPLPSAAISAALKRALDPAGVLNAGRGPV